MYRSNRNTSVWFDNDHKGTWQDRDGNNKIAPGMYQTSGQPPSTSARTSISLNRNMSKASNATVGVLTDKQRKISWNIGAVPFGSGSLRDLNPLKSFHTPGPDQYELIAVQGSKPQPMKGEHVNSP